MDSLVRVATAADIDAITEIYGKAVAVGSASFEVIPPSAAEMASRFRKVTEAGYPFVVAVRDNAILGFGYAGPYRDRPAYRNTVEDSVYLAESARGQGIGGAILRRLINDCTGLGYRQMVAVIGDSGNDASIHLHRAAGFQHVGTLKDVGFKHGRWLDVVLMQRTLGEGASTPAIG
jgi:phosphinothricin acetyltransferase